MKYFLYFFVLLQGLVMVSCATNDEEQVVAEPENTDTPLNFAAYVTRFSRDAATERDVVDVDALAQVGGFGVLGYAHGQRRFDDYVIDVTVPTFMVNQQVWDASQADADGYKGKDVPATEVWQYEPVKYFDNNEGALHSFFAYAPYRPDVDMVYAAGKAPQLRYNINQDIDLLWALPTKNMHKPGVDEKVKFDFSHALSKVTFHVVPFLDVVHTDEDHTLTDQNIFPVGTTIRVRSIHLNGNIPYVGLMNTETGQWAVSKPGEYFNVPNANDAFWTGDGVTPIMTYYDIAPSNKLIPTRDVAIEVVYDVITGSGDNKSHVTNKAVSYETFNLDQGKAYNFFLDLGFNSVKFSATVVDWSIEKSAEAEIVPLETVVPWQAGVSEDVTW